MPFWFGKKKLGVTPGGSTVLSYGSEAREPAIVRLSHTKWFRSSLILMSMRSYRTTNANFARSSPAA